MLNILDLFMDPDRVDDSLLTSEQPEDEVKHTYLRKKKFRKRTDRSTS